MMTEVAGPLNPGAGEHESGSTDPGENETTGWGEPWPTVERAVLR